MKAIRTLLLGALALCFSGCTVTHFVYLRNLSESAAGVVLVFDQAAAPSLKDSLFIPSSASSHLINGKTYVYMTDSIVARRIATTKLKLILPAGGMIVFDKNTSKKVGYFDPAKIEVSITDKQTKYEVVTATPGNDQKQFKSTGAHDRIYWHDIY